jgi:Tfp pilus assembly protein PilN
MSRLTVLHINIIGVFVAIAVGVGLYFLFIPKARTAINQNQQLLASTQQTADTLPTAQSDLKKAVAEKIALTKAYKVYEAQFMPT